MKYNATIPSNILKRGIKTVSPAIGSQSVLAIIESVHIALRGTAVAFTGTNLQTTYTVEIELGTINDEFEMCIDYKHLKEVADVLPDNSPVTIVYDEDATSVLITCGIGKNADKHTLGSQKAFEFPKAMQVDAAPIALPAELLRVSRIATNFTSKDTLRPAMTGVYFEGKDGAMRLVATDAHRLYRSGDMAIPEDVAMDFVVPTETMRIISDIKLADDEQIMLSFSSSHAIFKTNTSEIQVRLIDARFPDYKAVIPGHKTAFTANRAEFRSALRTVGVSANATTHQVIIKLQAQDMSFSASDNDFNKESKKEIRAVAQDCPDINFAMNHKMLSELLTFVDGEDLKVLNETPTRAFIFSGSNNDLFLQMPLMVGV